MVDTDAMKISNRFIVSSLLFGMFQIANANNIYYNDIIVAHGGGLNSNGCHHVRATGDYHCHRGRSDQSESNIVPHFDAKPKQGNFYNYADSGPSFDYIYNSCKLGVAPEIKNPEIEEKRITSMITCEIYIQASIDSMIFNEKICVNSSEKLSDAVNQVIIFGDYIKTQGEKLNNAAKHPIATQLFINSLFNNVYKCNKK